MTISERLKAIREAVNDLDIDTLGKNVPVIETQLDAIQASIDSVECDAGKIVDYARNNFALISLANHQTAVDYITTALLAQREKYDSLIAKAEGDANLLAQLIVHKIVDDGEGYGAIAKLITAALLKAEDVGYNRALPMFEMGRKQGLSDARQREWLPIDEEIEMLDAALFLATFALRKPKAGGQDIGVQMRQNVMAFISSLKQSGYAIQPLPSPPSSQDTTP